MLGVGGGGGGAWMMGRGCFYQGDGSDSITLTICLRCPFHTLIGCCTAHSFHEQLTPFRSLFLRSLTISITN